MRAADPSTVLTPARHALDLGAPVHLVCCLDSIAEISALHAASLCGAPVTSLHGPDTAVTCAPCIEADEAGDCPRRGPGECAFLPA